MASELVFGSFLYLANGKDESFISRKGFSENNNFKLSYCGELERDGRAC